MKLAKLVSGIYVYSQRNPFNYFLRRVNSIVPTQSEWRVHKSTATIPIKVKPYLFRPNFILMGDVRAIAYRPQDGPLGFLQDRRHPGFSPQTRLDVFLILVDFESGHHFQRNVGRMGTECRRGSTTEAGNGAKVCLHRIPSYR